MKRVIGVLAVVVALTGLGVAILTPVAAEPAR